MKTSDFLLIPNLLSLSRILLTPLVGYLLARNDDLSVYLCMGVLIVAVSTDALDGLLARKLNQQSELGLYLDPLADKLFAAVLLSLLVAFRNFPFWLAALIVGRDVLILFTGLLAVKARSITLPSNVTGQYTFFAVVMLVFFYVIRFEFGERLATVATVSLILASALSYGQRFILIMQGRPVPVFRDRPVYKWLRIGFTALLLGVCLVVFILERRK